MEKDIATFNVWIGGSCDYGHKERAGGAAVVIEHNGSIINRDVISDLHTTEFRMILTLMVKVMHELPKGSDILFLTNAAYIQNFDKTPTGKSANSDLIIQCIEAKSEHKSVCVKIVQYHKSPLLIETHDMATEAMSKKRKEYHHDNK
ncbi:MAG: ribonuclease H [Prevotella sp.]|nr:ribonuclease H [Prevotella sp.]